MFESLTRYLPELDSAEGFGELVVDRESAGTPDDPIRMPYVDYGHTATELERAIYAFVDGHPEYELRSYGEILERNGLKWSYDAMAGADVSKLDGLAVMALLLGAVRAERFSEGTLLGFLEDGCIERWLRRLQEIDASLSS